MPDCINHSKHKVHQQRGENEMKLCAISRLLRAAVNRSSSTSQQNLQNHLRLVPAQCLSTAAPKPGSCKRSVAFAHESDLHSLQEFYGNISANNLALMTLFDTDRYFKEAASSTIATALSTATPLIVEGGFCNVYTFVHPCSVVEVQDGDYVSAIRAVLQMNPLQWSRTVAEVGAVSTGP